LKVRIYAGGKGAERGSALEELRKLKT